MTMLALALTMTIGLATQPAAPVRIANWIEASRPLPRSTFVNNDVWVYEDGSLAWNGSRISDHDLRQFSRIVGQMSGALTTTVLLRPAVTAERREALIDMIGSSGACAEARRCILVRDWTGPFDDRPPPPPLPPR